MVTSTALRLISERNQPTCEVLGCENPAEEAHHCLYRKKKGKHPVPELDMDENLQLVCKPHHEVEAKSYKNKIYFWGVQCKRYGHEHMVDWHESLPLKIKEYGYR